MGISIETLTLDEEIEKMYNLLVTFNGNPYVGSLIKGRLDDLLAQKKPDNPRVVMEKIRAMA